MKPFNPLIRIFLFVFICKITACSYEKISLEDRFNASFTVENNNCDYPCEVRFLNSSIGATSYLWEFGDGDTSSQESPIHLYREEGRFLVKLTAFAESGNIALDTISVDIIDSNAPRAYFTIDSLTNNGYAPTTLFLSNLSKNASTYEWKLGNREVTNKRVPTPPHFDSPGEKVISLSVSDGTTTNTFEKKINIKEVQKFSYVSVDDSTFGKAACQLKDGSYVIVGSKSLGHYGENFRHEIRGLGYLVHLDSSGNFIFSDTLRDRYDQRIDFALHDVVPTSDGGYMTFSRFRVSKYSRTDERLNSFKVSDYIYRAIPTVDNKIAIIGRTDWDYFFELWDEEGNTIQGTRKFLQIRSSNRVHILLQLSDKSFLVGGGNSGNPTFAWAPFFEKLDKNGNSEWYEYYSTGNRYNRSGPHTEILDAIEFPKNEVIAIGYHFLSDRTPSTFSYLKPHGYSGYYFQKINPLNGDLIDNFKNPVLGSPSSRFIPIAHSIMLSIDSIVHIVGQDIGDQYLYKLNNSGGVYSPTPTSLYSKQAAIKTRDGGLIIVGSDNDQDPGRLMIIKTDGYLNQP